MLDILQKGNKKIQKSFFTFLGAIIEIFWRFHQQIVNLCKTPSSEIWVGINHFLKNPKIKVSTLDSLMTLPKNTKGQIQHSKNISTVAILQIVAFFWNQLYLRTHLTLLMSMPSGCPCLDHLTLGIGSPPGSHSRTKSPPTNATFKGAGFLMKNGGSENIG